MFYGVTLMLIVVIMLLVLDHKSLGREEAQPWASIKTMLKFTLSI